MTDHRLHRPLAGLVVGLSISESDETRGLGYPAWRVREATVQIVRVLFGQGVGIVFGHDWRPDGVMSAVHAWAAAMQPAAGEADGRPLLHNLVPWPDRPTLTEHEREQLSRTLRVQEVGLPDELAAYADEARAQPDGDLHRYLRARGLTHLRRRLESRCRARLCIGGRTGGAAGRYPGIVEEALLAVEAGKPLYLAGALGGAARQVIEALRERRTDERFARPDERLERLYGEPPVREHDPATRADRRIDPDEVREVFARYGVGRLAEANGLSIEENEVLFETPALEHVPHLVLTGLARLAGRRREPPQRRPY